MNSTPGYVQPRKMGGFPKKISAHTSAAREAIKVPYKIHYALKAQQDMAEVWSDVLVASGENEVANRNVPQSVINTPCNE